MDAKERLRERKERANNVFAFRHNKHVLSASNNSYWNVFDAGYNALQARDDSEILLKTQELFMERYQFDILLNYIPPLGLLKAMKDYGPQNFFITEKGDAMVLKDYCVMEREEYPEVTKNFDQFLWEKIALRKMKQGITVGQFEEMLNTFKGASATTMKMAAAFSQKYGTLTCSKIGPQVPVEFLVSYSRGIRNTSLDMRKCQEEILKFSDAHFENQVMPMLQGAVGIDESDAAAPVQIAMLAHSIMNVKQFEKFYWPYMKRMVDFCAEHDLKIWFYTEAEILRFAEFFREIPKGLAVVQVEIDDVREVRRQIPNVAIAGGMPLDMLANSTPEQCIDHVKALVDEMGDGFILDQDKMICTANDARRENLLAVNEFLRNTSF